MTEGFCGYHTVLLFHWHSKYVLIHSNRNWLPLTSCNLAYHMYSTLSPDCYCCPHCQHVHAKENKLQTLPEVTQCIPMHKKSKHNYGVAKLENSVRNACKSLSATARLNSSYNFSILAWKELCQLSTCDTEITTWDILLWQRHAYMLILKLAVKD